MAHYAQLDENNVVLQVIVVSNNDEKDENEIESEQTGIQFCKNLFGQNTNWKKCSYNTYRGVYYNPSNGEPDADQSKAFRKNYPGVGFFYDDQNDCFVEPSLYPSWTFDLNTGAYQAPVPYPSDGGLYVWDENNQQWVGTDTPEAIAAAQQYAQTLI